MPFPKELLEMLQAAPAGRSGVTPQAGLLGADLPQTHVRAIAKVWELPEARDLWSQVSWAMRTSVMGGQRRSSCRPESPAGYLALRNHTSFLHKIKITIIVNY